MNRDTADILPRIKAEARAPVEPDGVIERLFHGGPHFNFYQAVWLLENLLADAEAPGRAAGRETERVRIRPHHAESFPVSDVRSVEWTGNETAQVTVTFMGLYGVDSPMPANFHRSIALESDEAGPLRMFLDIFNHRFYTYFYRAWKKYRPHLSFDRTYQNRHAERFVSLSGLGLPGSLFESPAQGLRLSSFAGSLGNWTRNGAGLETLLNGFLGDVGVAVEENIPRWVPVGQRAELGRNGVRSVVLGVNAVVGRRLFDVSGKFRLVLGPLTFEQYRELLPGNEKARLVHWLTRTYAPDFLAFDVKLLLNAEDVPRLTLGGSDVRLGINTWVGRPAGAVVSDVVMYES